MVITSPDDATTDAIAEGRTPLETIDRLASLPCIVIAVSRPPDDTPPLADLVIDPAVASLFPRSSRATSFSIRLLW